MLYFGALGDRYGRKLMLLVGTALAIPFSVLAAWSPNEQVLFVARIGGGLSAGMAYPTTLALITALWSGPGRTRVDRPVVRHRRRPSPRWGRCWPGSCSSTSGGARSS